MPQETNMTINIGGLEIPMICADGTPYVPQAELSVNELFYGNGRLVKTNFGLRALMSKEQIIAFDEDIQNSTDGDDEE